MKFAAAFMAAFMALQSVSGGGAVQPKEVDVTDVTLTGIVQEVTETEIALRVMPERKEGQRPEGRGHGKCGEKPAEETEAAETTDENSEEGRGRGKDRDSRRGGKGGRDRKGHGKGHGRGHGRGRNGKQMVTLSVSTELLTDIERGDCVTVTTDTEGVVTALTENAKPERPQKKEESNVETAEEAVTSEA